MCQLIVTTCHLTYFRARQSRARADVKLTLKIFFLLGLTWIFDIKAFALEPYELSHIEVSILIIIFLVINASHGIIFFFTVFFTSATTKKISTWCGGTNVGRMVSNYYSSLRTTTTSGARTTITHRSSIGKDPLTKKTKVEVRLNSTKKPHETPLWTSRHISSILQVLLLVLFVLILQYEILYWLC